MSAVEALKKSVRLRGLLNLFLQIDVLAKTRDPGFWIAVLLFYIGCIGTILTSLVAAFAGPVMMKANTVPTPDALPIISPELKKVFISWPQLYYGLGVHGHMITALYFWLPAYVALIVLAVIGYPGARKFLWPRGDFRDFVDHILLWIAFITAGLPNIALMLNIPGLTPELMLATHRIIGWLWVVISMVSMGVAFRVTAIVLTSIWQLILGKRLPGFMKRVAEIDPWYQMVTAEIGAA